MVCQLISNGTNEQQATVLLIAEHNAIACMVLTLASYSGYIKKLTLKPTASTRVVTIVHFQAQIELLSQAKTHGNIQAAMGIEKWGKGIVASMKAPPLYKK
jgi:hypothetical protein